MGAPPRAPTTQRATTEPSTVLPAAAPPAAPLHSLYAQASESGECVPECKRTGSRLWSTAAPPSANRSTPRHPYFTASGGLWPTAAPPSAHAATARPKADPYFAASLAGG